jgi:hypothetical protein
MGFEPTIPVFERAKAVHALDRAATVICVICVLVRFYCGQARQPVSVDCRSINNYVAGIHIFMLCAISRDVGPRIFCRLQHCTGVHWNIVQD